MFYDFVNLPSLPCLSCQICKMGTAWPVQATSSELTLRNTHFEPVPANQDNFYHSLALLTLFKRRPDWYDFITKTNRSSINVPYISPQSPWLHNVHTLAVLQTTDSTGTIRGQSRRGPRSSLSQKNLLQVAC